MAKKAKAADKIGKVERKAAKAAKAGKIPKQIGSLKIPKEVRKDGDKLLSILRNPVVTELAAAGLIAFAEGMRQNSRGKAKAAAAADPDEAAAAARRTAARCTSELGEVAALVGTLLATRTGDRTKH